MSIGEAAEFMDIEVDGGGLQTTFKVKFDIGQGQQLSADLVVVSQLKD